MKSIAYILSFVVLVLTAIPCKDSHKDDTWQKIELTQKTTHSNNQNNNQHQGAGHCSPFCVCQCCQANFFVSIPVVLSPSDAIEISYSVYSPSFQSADLFDFPKPPKA